MHLHIPNANCLCQYGCRVQRMTVCIARCYVKLCSESGQEKKVSVSLHIRKDSRAPVQSFPSDPQRFLAVFTSQLNLLLSLYSGTNWSKLCTGQTMEMNKVLYLETSSSLLILQFKHTPVKTGVSSKPILKLTS